MAEGVSVAACASVAAAGPPPYPPPQAGEGLVCDGRTGANMSTPPADSVDPKLLEILVCPLTKCPLEYDAEKQELISRAAKLAYPIRDGIPIMLPEEARRLD